MEALLLGLIEKYPIMSQILMAIGILRIVNKPLFSILQSVADFTEFTQKDNELLKKILESKIYKYFSYVLDYSASIKMPQKEKEQEQELIVGEANLK